MERRTSQWPGRKVYKSAGKPSTEVIHQKRLSCPREEPAIVFRSHSVKEWEQHMGSVALAQTWQWISEPGSRGFRSIMLPAVGGDLRNKFSWWSHQSQLSWRSLPRHWVSVTHVYRCLFSITGYVCLNEKKFSLYIYLVEKWVFSTSKRSTNLLLGES